MSIVTWLDNADHVHGQTKHQSNNIIREHARVGIVPFASFVLFISLCLGQTIKSEAHSDEHHTLSEAWVRIFALFGKNFFDIEDYEAQSNEEGNDELFWLWCVNASECSNEDDWNNFRRFTQNNERIANHFHSIWAAIHATEIEDGYNEVSPGKCLWNFATSHKNDHARNYNGDRILEAED